MQLPSGVICRELKLDAKGPPRFSSRTVRREIVFRSLDETMVRLARNFYERAARNTVNPLIGKNNINSSVQQV